MRNRAFAFFAAAGRWGISLMTGGLFSWTFAAYEHFSGKSIPGFWWAVLGFALFMIGAFLAWNDEHNKYEIEKQKHDNPNFTLAVESVLTAYNQAQNGTTICFAASLTNRGSASHATGWILRYQSSTIDMTVKYVSLEEEKTIFPVSGDRDLILKRLDLLPARTLAAIERGHTRHGRLLFELVGDRRSEIFSGAAQMRIGCFDITGRLCQADFITDAQHLHSSLNTYPDEETVKRKAKVAKLPK
jgi:hypothetical protein